MSGSSVIVALNAVMLRAFASQAGWSAALVVGGGGQVHQPVVRGEEPADQAHVGLEYTIRAVTCFFP